MRLNKTKIIKEIIGEAIKNYGYEYIGYSGEWKFEKIDGNVKRYIYIVPYRHSKERITVELGTNLPETGRFQAIEFTKNFDNHIGYWNCMSDEAHFTIAIEKIKDALLQGGIPFIESYDENSIAKIYEDAELYLYNHHSELKVECMKRFEIEDDTFTEQSVNEWFEKFIKEEAKVRDDEKELIKLCMQITALIGDCFCNYMGAKWILEEREFDGKKYCMIMNIKSVPNGFRALRLVLPHHTELDNIRDIVIRRIQNKIS